MDMNMMDKYKLKYKNVMDKSASFATARAAWCMYNKNESCYLEAWSRGHVVQRASHGCHGGTTTEIEEDAAAWQQHRSSPNSHELRVTRSRKDYVLYSLVIGLLVL
jgi:hypothetical protein